MLNISTVWNIERYNSINDSIEELKSMGFHSFELAWINENKYKNSKRGDFLVQSVHNFFPDPPIIPEGRWPGNAFKLTAIDLEERKLAVQYTKHSIDNAIEFGAEVLVVHFGEQETPITGSLKLTQLYQKGEKNSKEYKKLQNKIWQERKSLHDKYFENGLFSLDEVNKYALKKGIKIGIETRLYYEELPNLEEFMTIFEKFKGSHLYYWHDIGHATCQQELGFIVEEEYFNNLKNYLVGMHIHDVKNLNDHKAPGTGDVDFTKYKKYFTNNSIIKVLEAHSLSTREQVMNAKKLLNI